MQDAHIQFYLTKSMNINLGQNGSTTLCQALESHVIQTAGYSNIPYEAIISTANLATMVAYAIIRAAHPHIPVNLINS